MRNALKKRLGQIEHRMNATAEPLKITVLYENHSEGETALSDAAIQALWGRYGQQIEVIPPEGFKWDLSRFDNPDEGRRLRSAFCNSEDPERFVSSLTEEEYSCLLANCGYLVVSGNRNTKRC